MTAKQICKYLGACIIGFVIGILVNIPSCQKQPEQKIEYIYKTDTIVKTDIQIKEKTIVKYVNTIDTFYILQPGDTVYVKDLPIEHKEYNDVIQLKDSTSLKVDIKYSGFKASIDSLNFELQQREQIRTITKQAKKFGWDVTIGPSIGYGLSFPPGGKYMHGPYIGVSLTIGPSFRISK